MTPTNNTAILGRGKSQPRDVTTHRRAYLDTYAKRRSLELNAANQDRKPAVQSQPVTAPSQTQVIPYIPQVVEQPPVVAPSSTQQPAQVRHSVAQPVQKKQSHRTYLDTLHRRHQQAVHQAPARIETVFTPELNQATEQLLEDSEVEKRIEANLRALYDTKSLTDQITKSTASASASHIRTIVGSALACGILAIGMFSFVSGYDTQPAVAQPIGSPVIEVEAPVSKTPPGTPLAQNNAGAPILDPAYPVKMVISSIGVNAPVESLGTTPDGLIAVPQSYGVVGWYNKSSIPGKTGPTVLVGHYTGGNGGVFDKLTDLNNGDLITTTNGRGQSVTYKVSAKNVYEKDQVPMAELFKKGDGSRLEIITCTGKWQAKTYNQRLVITAEIVQ